jgi:O-antigen/teichoic acid export membrane protein
VRKVAAQVGVVFASRLMIRLCQLVSFFVLARSLTLPEFGIYGIVSSVIFFSGLVGNLGLRQSSTRLINTHDLHAGEVTSTLVACWPLLSVATAFAILLLSPQQLSSLSIYNLIYVMIAASAYLLLTLLQGILLGSGDTIGFAFLDSGPRLAQACLVILLAAFGMITLSAALATFAIGFVIFVPIGLIRSYRLKGFRKPSSVYLRSLFSVGLVNTFALLMAMLQDRIGLFMLGYMGKSADAGNYFAAQRISEIFLDVATSLALIVFAEGARSKDPAKGLSDAMKVAFTVGLLFTLLGGVAALVGPPVIFLALGSSFHGAQPALVVFCLGLGPLAAARIMSSAVSGVGRPILSGAVSGAGLVANAVVCAILLSRYGAVGAAAGMLVGQIVCIIGYLFVCRFVFKLEVRGTLPGQIELKSALGRLRRRLQRAA